MACIMSQGSCNQPFCTEADLFLLSKHGQVHCRAIRTLWRIPQAWCCIECLVTVACVLNVCCNQWPHDNTRSSPEIAVIGAGFAFFPRNFGSKVRGEKTDSEKVDLAPSAPQTAPESNPAPQAPVISKPPALHLEICDFVSRTTAERMCFAHLARPAFRQQVQSIRQCFDEQLRTVLADVLLLMSSPQGSSGGSGGSASGGHAGAGYDVHVRALGLGLQGSSGMLNGRVCVHLV